MSSKHEDSRAAVQASWAAWDAIEQETRQAAGAQASAGGTRKRKKKSKKQKAGSTAFTGELLRPGPVQHLHSHGRLRGGQESNPSCPQFAAPTGIRVSASPSPSPSPAAAEGAAPACAAAPAWAHDTLACIRKAHQHMITADLPHPPISGLPLQPHLPSLHRIRSAALLLLTCTDVAIFGAHDRLARLQQAFLSNTEEQLKARQTQCQKVSDLLAEKLAKLDKQEVAFRDEKSALLVHQRELERQLDEEKEKFLCCVCLEKPRNTIVLPCLHFQYCSHCLQQHRQANSNTCPTCRRPIEELRMPSL